MTLWDLLDKHPNWTPIFLFFALLGLTQKLVERL